MDLFPGSNMISRIYYTSGKYNILKRSLEIIKRRESSLLGERIFIFPYIAQVKEEEEEANDGRCSRVRIPTDVLPSEAPSKKKKLMPVSFEAKEVYSREIF